MIGALKLTVYFGERDRARGAFLADRILGICEAGGIATSVLLRGAEGFGIKHHRRTDRLLTLSEDLPLIAIAIDGPQRIADALACVRRLDFDGLVTVERARVGSAGDLAVEAGADDAVKLTLLVGRGELADGRPAYEAAMETLRESRVDGGAAFVGVDGTLAGERRRARFFARNAGTPAMLVSVGSAESFGRARAGLASISAGAAAVVERVRILKRDGRWLGELPRVEPEDAAGLGRWIKLMLHSAEQNHFAGRPVHIEAVHRLRRENARGATAIRGIWGYHGDHAPHGDTIRSLRRRVPTLTVAVDTPEASARWLEILDEITPERGLITCEVVPAYQATFEGSCYGGLSLSAPWG
ncbi:MAG: DUF190 domain-containing protein [Thermoleophilia bacterium]|nr:DUF190 domain-containing protein [Thermoleophilia bacterium]